MPLVPVLQDLQIERRVRALGHRPEQRIGIIGIDVLVHRDDVFGFVAFPF